MSFTYNTLLRRAKEQQTKFEKENKTSTIQVHVTKQTLSLCVISTCLDKQDIVTIFLSSDFINGDIKYIKRVSQGIANELHLDFEFLDLSKN